MSDESTTREVTPEQQHAEELLEAGAALHFHVGDQRQGYPLPVEEGGAPPPPSGLRAPRSKPRWGYDDEGNEIVAPAGGLVFDPEVGAAVIPGEEEEAEEEGPAPEEEGPAPEEAPPPPPPPAPPASRQSRATGTPPLPPAEPTA